MISEASSAVQGLMATVSGKTDQKGQGQGGFLALLQDSTGSASGEDGTQGLLAALKGQSNHAGTTREDLQAALRDALSSRTGASQVNKGEGDALTEDELEALSAALVQLAQAQKEGGVTPGMLSQQPSGQESDAPNGLLEALSQLAKNQGSEQAEKAVNRALNRLQANSVQGTPGNSPDGSDTTALTELQAQLDDLMQKLEGIANQGGSEDQLAPQAPSLKDLLASLEDTLGHFKETVGQDSEQQQILADLQDRLNALQQALNNDDGQKLDLAALLKTHDQNRTPEQAGSAMGGGQVSPSSDKALSELGAKLENLLQNLNANSNGKSTEGRQDMLQSATQREIAASRGQDAARDGEPASRQAAVSTTAEQQEQLAQRQQAAQALSDKQAAELYEALRQAGKALQNEAATQALERNLARLSQQAGGVTRLAEALSSLQGRDDSLSNANGHRGPETLNALSFESQLRNAGQAQQASAQAQQAAKSQGGPAADQIAMKIHKAVAGGNDRISVQLHPAELGRVDVKLEFGQDGLLRASITAERPETLDLLQRDVRALERALSDAGVKTDSGSLNFNSRNTAGQQQAFDQNQGGSSASGEQRLGQDAASEEAHTNTNEDATRPGYSRGLINLSV